MLFHLSNQSVSKKLCDVAFNQYHMIPWIAGFMVLLLVYACVFRKRFDALEARLAKCEDERDLQKVRLDELDKQCQCISKNSHSRIERMFYFVNTTMMRLEQMDQTAKKQITHQKRLETRIMQESCDRKQLLNTTYSVCRGFLPEIYGRNNNALIVEYRKLNAKFYNENTENDLSV